MTPEEFCIYITLTTNPGMMHVTPDGSKLYLLVDEGLVHFSGPDFNKMDAEQLNRFVQDAILDGMNKE